MGREEEIRIIAHRIWEQEGCGTGHDFEQWLKAEAILGKRQKIIKIWRRVLFPLVAVLILGLVPYYEYKSDNFQISHMYFIGIIFILIMVFWVLTNLRSMKFDIVTKIWAEIGNWLPWTRKEVFSFLSYSISQAVCWVFVIGLIGYFLYALQHEPGDYVAFQMTTISGILGGLVLSGGLIEGKSPLGTVLRRVGIYFIVSALGFVLLGLFAPLLDKLPPDELSFKVSELAFQVGFTIGVIGFSFAVANLTVIIPKLWKRE